MERREEQLLGKRTCLPSDETNTYERQIPRSGAGIVEELMYGIDESDYEEVCLGRFSIERRRLIRNHLMDMSPEKLVERHKKMFKDLHPSIPAKEINQQQVQRDILLGAFIQDCIELEDDSDEDDRWQKEHNKANMIKKVSAARLAQTQPEKPEAERKALSNAERKRNERARKKKTLTSEEELELQRAKEQKAKERREAKAACEKARRAREKARRSREKAIKDVSGK